MSEHNTDRAQIAALGAANIGNPITGKLIDAEAAIAAIERLNHGCKMVRAKLSVTARAIAAIRALPARPQPADHIGEATEMVAPAVKVKALVWEVTESGAIVAETSIGEYVAEFPYRSWILTASDGSMRSFVQLEAAKTAAQADYEARILAALEGGDA